MDTIGQQKIWTFPADADGAAVAPSCTTVRAGAAHRVGSYLELASKIAELQFLNRDFVLFLRGQRGDHRNRQNNTSLKPSIMRPSPGRALPNTAELELRFARLAVAERLLVEDYEAGGFMDPKRLKRHRIARWAILQHYEICPTPLLDVTQSLRIAASFASDPGPDPGAARPEEAHVFVLGAPGVFGTVTASAEAELQILRLSGVCPAVAVRPHIQEGYLFGNYPDLDAPLDKAVRKHFEIDFGRRLVAKFVFDPKTFWSDPDFPPVPRRALYPDGRDPMFGLAERVRTRLPTVFPVAAVRLPVTSKPKPAKSRAR